MSDGVHLVFGAASWGDLSEGIFSEDLVSGRSPKKVARTLHEENRATLGESGPRDLGRILGTAQGEVLCVQRRTSE